MEFTSRCPECEEQNDLALDLREIMERIKKADFTKPVVFGDVEKKLGFSYFNNQQHKDLRLYETANKLSKALYSIL